MSMARTRADGFTLLELLVVLAIMGLMVAIAMPFTVSTIAQAGLRADARALTSQLRRLQHQAQERRETIVIATLAVHTLPGAVFAAPQAGRGTVTLAGGRPVIFYPDGTSSGGTLRLREGGRALDIGVAWMTGAIDVRVAP